MPLNLHNFKRACFLCFLIVSLTFVINSISNYYYVNEFSSTTYQSFSIFSTYQYYHVITPVVEENHSNQSHFRKILAESQNRQWHLTPPVNQSGVVDYWSIHVLSAYYDHRINKTVVLHASQMTMHRKLQYPKSYALSCLLFDSDGNLQFSTEAKFHNQIFIHCDDPVVKGHVPAYLYIQRNDSVLNDVVFDWLIPVKNLKSQQMEISAKNLSRDFAVCTGMLHQHQNWLMLIQFIEYNLMQGVQKMIIFVRDLLWQTEANRIFQYYKANFDESYLEVIPWTVNFTGCPQPYYCKWLFMTYCTYENMYKFKYIGHMDFDELLYPVKSSSSENLVALMQRIDKPECGQWTFRAKYHTNLTMPLPEMSNVSNWQTSEIVEKFLPIATFNNVSGFMSYGFSPKSVYKPEKILIGGIHNAEQLVIGSKNCHVNDSDGFMRHFKIREKWGEYYATIVDQKTKYKSVNLTMEIGELFLSNLRNRVINVLHAIFNV